MATDAGQSTGEALVNSSVDELLELIEARPADVELVVTGRRADPRLLERADLVTEMREVKHAYQAGIRAKRGIDY